MKLSSLLVLLMAAAYVQSGDAATIDFEGLADSTVLTAQYPGVTFSNANVATAGVSLNSAQFPPHSGVNVATDAGGPMTITFATPVQVFSGYFTHSATLTLTGFNALGQVVTTTTSPTAINRTSSTGIPNELLQLTSASGISRVTIAGDLAGFSFTLDDLTYSSSSSSGLTTTAPISLYNNYLAYTLNANNLAVQSETITVAYSTNFTPFTSSVSGGLASSPVFVNVYPASGTTPGQVSITTNPAGLPPGTYNNSILFQAGGVLTTYQVSLTIEPAGPQGTGAATPAKVGIFRQTPAAGLTVLGLLDRNGDGTCCSGDLIDQFGAAGDIPLAGDWTGDGVKKLGLYRPSTGLFLLDVNNNGTFDGVGAGLDAALFLPVQAGDVPVVGDWTGSGIDRVGVFRGSVGTFYLDRNGDGSFVGRSYLGQSGDIPLVGNWNGFGHQSKVGIYRPTSVNGQPGNFFLVDGNGDGLYNSLDPAPFFLGQSGDVPLVGDWNGDGRSKVGIFRPAGGGAGLFVLDSNGSYFYESGVDSVLFFSPAVTGTTTTNALPGDIPVTGNWVPSYGASNTSNVQGRARVGIYRPSSGTFFLDVSADGTFQGQAFFGQMGDVPVGVPVISNGTILGVTQLGNY